ncbi:MAG: PD-(D/E)XK nuclease family protein [Deltaproteobacteria bacterium]|nr:PD-(D/E)XK nuclease family protein [Deltaproteobacteria bacterium]
MDTSSDSVALEKFFTEIRARMETHEQYKKLYASTLSPDFNMISCMNPDENRLSSLIAMLLYPKGEHGQGDIFLRCFLQTIKTPPFPYNSRTEKQIEKIDELLKQQNLSEGRSTRILEALTTEIPNSQRRIDIFFNLNGFGLAIENKPWAIDQPGQLSDYIEHLNFLKKKGSLNDFFLIYLSRDGEPPAENSINHVDLITFQDIGNLIVVAYKQLIDWCKLCVEKCNSHRLRFFLEDFICYIMNNFSGGVPMIDQKLIIDAATKKENIPVCVAVAKSWPEISRNLVEELVNSVIRLINLNDDWCKPMINFGINISYSGFYFYKKNWNDCCIGFEFDGKNATNFFYGIQKRSMLKDASSQLQSKKLIDLSGLGSGSYSKVWPWWNYFDSPFRDWNTSDEAWIGIKDNGDTVKIVAERLMQIINISEKAIDEFES